MTGQFFPRTVRRAFFVGVLTIATTVGFCQSGGGYDLTWSTVDAGSLILTGGGYELVGTVGQPDALVLSGGGYELSGGFLQDSDTIALPVGLSAYSLE